MSLPNARRVSKVESIGSYSYLYWYSLQRLVCATASLVLWLGPSRTVLDVVGNDAGKCLAGRVQFEILVVRPVAHRIEVKVGRDAFWIQRRDAGATHSVAPKPQLVGECRSYQDKTPALSEHWPGQREPSGYVFAVGIFAVLNFRRLDMNVEDGNGAIGIGIGYEQIAVNDRKKASAEL